MVAWAEAAARLERWLLPAECLVCRAPVAGDDEPLACPVCRARWRPVALPQCGRCGEHRPSGLACRVCASWPPDFGPVQSAVRLDPSARRLVHRFKYQGWRRLAESFAIPMAPLIQALPPGDLVPVPLARSRQRARGYNQAEALAEAIGRRTGRAVRPDRIARVRETVTQTRLTPEARRANLAEAFVARHDSRPCILIDDVFTTGATLLSAASGLLDGGAEQVAAVTFARAELPLAGVTLAD